MTKFIGILSGKGGVGKTMTSMNLSAALNYLGKETILVDANFSNPNIGLHLGFPNQEINLNKVLQGKKHIIHSIYSHESGTKVIPSSISLDEIKKTNPSNLKLALLALEGLADFAIIDASSGMKEEVFSVIESSDEVLIVTNPDIISVTEALKTISLVRKSNKSVLGVVLNKIGSKYDLSEKNIESLLGASIISKIPLDESIPNSIIKKDISVCLSPKSKSSIAYKKLAADISCQPYSEVNSKKNFFKRLFRRK